MDWRTKLSECGNDDLAAAMVAAIESLFDRDGYLFRRNVHERTISALLTFHMRQQFEASDLLRGFDIDPEFNKLGDDPKGAVVDDKEVRVVPDIIVHRRGVKYDDNVLVIEIKCSPRGTKKDIRKLRGMKHSLQYDHALFIRFGVRKHAGEIIDMKWIADDPAP